jgi:hypothetical protein
MFTISLYSKAQTSSTKHLNIYFLPNSKRTATSLTVNAIQRNSCCLCDQIYIYKLLVEFNLCKMVVHVVFTDLKNILIPNNCNVTLSQHITRLFIHNSITVKQFNSLITCKQGKNVYYVPQYYCTWYVPPSH